MKFYRLENPVFSWKPQKVCTNWAMDALFDYYIWLFWAVEIRRNYRLIKVVTIKKDRSR